MRQFISIVCLALSASVSAKPGTGYLYNAPGKGSLSASLLPPSSILHQQFAPSHGSLGLSHSSKGGSLALGSSYSATSNTHNQHNVHGLSFNSHSNGHVSAPFVSNVPATAFSSGLDSIPQSFDTFGSSSPSFNTFNQPAAEQAIIQKHIYVHVPPPEAEEREILNVQQPISHQKHYKIIFIKAPSAPSPSRQALLQQQALQQSEEKTLVYVLVKKPDSFSDIQAQIPQIQSAPSSKPEVYFIKYRAEKDGGLRDFSASLPSSSSLGHSQDLASSVSVSTTSSGEGSSLSSSSVSEIIQPRTPAPEYGPPKH